MSKDVAALSGAELIWATCRALGHAPVFVATGVAYHSDHGAWVYPRYTSDEEVGELIAKHKVSVERPSARNNGAWRATMAGTDGVDHIALGKTLGEAVCRVIVLCRLGTEITLPERAA